MTDIQNGYKECLNHLEYFIKRTCETLNHGLKQQEETHLISNWKYQLMAPLAYLMESLTQNYKRVFNILREKTSTEEFDSLENKISEAKNLSKSLYKENLIDITQAFIRFQQVHFPKDSNQQVYIGNLDENGKRRGQGSLSDGDLMYNGSWLDDKRHGFGTQVYEDGEIFSGKWFKGKPKISRWVFDDQRVFYGINNRVDDKDLEWQLGLMSEDFDKIKSAFGFLRRNPKKTSKDLKEVNIPEGYLKLRNIFFYEDEATQLRNVYLKEGDDINIQALTGDKPMEKTKIMFLDGLSYEGHWKNFEPDLIGVVSIPGTLSLKILTRSGRTLAYSSIRPHPQDLGKFTEEPDEEDLIEMVSQDKTIQKLVIEFLDGTTYQGSVNQNLEFHGYGVVTYPEGGFYHGIFTYSDGLLVRFSNECRDEIEKVDASEYFADSIAYKEKNPDVDDIWIELIDGFGSPTHFFYKGNWLDFYPDGIGMIKESKEMTGMKCFTDDHLIFNPIGYTKEKYMERIEMNKGNIEKDFYYNDEGEEISIEFSEDEMADRREIRKRIENEIDNYEFGDGSTYVGKSVSDNMLYDPHGYGRLVDEDGTAFEGMWQFGTLVVDIKLIDTILLQTQVYGLKSGFHKIEYEGEWKDYLWTNGGKIIKTDGTEIIFEINEEDEDDNEYILEMMAEHVEQRAHSRKGRKPLVFVNIDNFTSGSERSPKIQTLYSKLLNRQKEKIQDLIDYDFIDPITAEYIPSSKIYGDHIIENGFEINYMNPSNDNLLQFKVKDKNFNENDFSINSLYLYNQREKVDSQLDMKKKNFGEIIKKIDKNSYFKPVLGKNGKVDHKKSLDKFKSLTSRGPYYQIGYNGLLVSTVDLFQLSLEEKKYPKKYQLTPLSSDKSFIYSMYYLNKINGICEVKNNKIMFYNGDEYEFLGSERNYTDSLGNWKKDKKSKFFQMRKQDNQRIVYWGRFFSKVNLCRFHESMTDELKLIYKGKIDKGRKQQFTFNKGEFFEVTWFDGVPFGNGHFINEDDDLKMNYTRFESGSSAGLRKKFWFGFRIYDDVPASDSLIDYLKNKDQEHYRRIMINIYKSQKSMREMIESKKFKITFDVTPPEFQTEIKQEFKVYFENNPSSTAMSIYKGIKDKLVKNDQPTLEMKIEYPNGDIYEGFRDKRGLAFGDGQYFWSDGFAYDGQFLLNEPFGKGKIIDVFGNKLEGFFFRGFALRQPYGLDKLAEELRKNYCSEDGSGIVFESSDLDIISDPELMLGSSKFKHISIGYGKIYSEIKANRKLMGRMMRDIRDGEQDYKGYWGDILRADVRQLLMSEQEEIKPVREEGKMFNVEKNEENDEILEKIKNVKFEFILKRLDTSSVSNWVSEQIVELIKDEEFLGIREVYQRFVKDKRELKFFEIKDMKNRNPLMIAAQFGHRQVFLDMLTALRRMIKTQGEKILEKVISIFKHKDNENNNLIDLTCIRGFNVDDEEIFSYMVKPKIDEDSENYEKMKNFDIEDLANWDIEQIEKMYSGPHTYLEMIRMMKDDTRELFKSNYMTYSKISKIIDKIEDKSKIESSDIFFVSKRAICLNSLFNFFSEFDIKSSILLNKTEYDEKKNNPLHFLIYWGDLHAILEILSQDNSIMFWRNKDKELPPQIIRFSGKNSYKANAVFGSVLEEITRHFNFRMITELLIDKKNGILYEHRLKLGLEINEDENLRMKLVEEIEKKLSEGKNDEFDEENIFLYKNNYILRQDELCKQYLQYLKRKSAYRQLKREFRVMKKSVFAQVSELESLQRNFLDYYKGSFRNYHSPAIVKKYREDVQELLTWYVFIFGNAEINPEIYTLLDIDPYEIILGGRNIFHYMCENNSHALLKSFLDYLYEQCHDRPFDISVESFEDWDKSLDKERFEEFKEKLNTPTKFNQNTPAHLSIIHNNEDCLEILLSYNIDIDVINVRGRTVREFLMDREPYNLSADLTLRPSDIAGEIVDYVTNDILTTCKQHSLKYEFIEKSKHEDFQKILKGSLYQLNDDLTSVRDVVLKKMKKFGYEFKDSYDRIKTIKKFLKMFLEIQKMSEKEKNVKLEHLRNVYLGVEAGMENMDNEMIYYLLTALEGEKFMYIPQREILETLLEPDFLITLKNFKYKKYEKMIKKEFLDVIETLDFSKPLPKFLKSKFSMDQLFCIEIKMTKIKRDGNIQHRDMVERQIVINQINNIRKKYMKYGGGIRAEILKGFPIKRPKGIKFWKKSEYDNSWFILISISDKLLKKMATEQQMDAYNFKRKFHTVFFENAIDSHELEPLRHFQKIKIMMHLLNKEFDIDRFKKKGLISKYFPIHDYKQRKVILKLWAKYKWTIHFWDAWQETKSKTLQVLSLISFYHGIQQGFYFGFLALYTNYMLYLAIFGLFASSPVLILEGEFTLIKILSPLIVGLWSTFFVNMWKRREKELAYSFDSMEEEAIKTVRLKYRGESIIDEGTLSISKKVKERWFLKLLFTTIMFVTGASLVLGIWGLVTYLNRRIDESDLEKDRKSLYTFGVGIINGSLNFIVSVIYEAIVNKLVIWENHAYEFFFLFLLRYDEDMRTSKILKKYTFKIVASLFTLVAQILIERKEYNFISIQVLSNLLTSTILNYTLSVALPFWQFLTTRYYFYSYLLSCKCCCCKSPVGRVEKFKEDIIKKMLVDKDVKDTFIRYILNEKPDKKLIQEVNEEVWVKTGEKIMNKKGDAAQRDEIKKKRKKRIAKKIAEYLSDSEKISKILFNKKNNTENMEEELNDSLKPEKMNKIHPLISNPSKNNLDGENEIKSGESSVTGGNTHNNRKNSNRRSNETIFRKKALLKIEDEEEKSLLRKSPAVPRRKRNKLKTAFEKEIDIHKLSKKNLSSELILSSAEIVKPRKEYSGPCLSLGTERKRNIKLRLREKFIRYVLGREKIIETSYMLDLGSLEENLYSSLLIQFTFICFFTPYLISSGLVSYVLNIIVIFLTINLYTKVTRRPISRRVTNIGIWNNMFNVISYLGIIFNALIISISGDEFGSEAISSLIPGERKASDVIYNIQSGLLVAKFILSLLIPNLPKSVHNKVTRENLRKERERKQNSKMMSRLSKEKMEKELEHLENNEEDEATQGSSILNELQQNLKAQASILEDENTKNLKFYFENDLKLMDFEQMVYQISSKTGEKLEIPKPVVKVKKVKKNNRKK